MRKAILLLITIGLAFILAAQKTKLVPPVVIENKILSLSNDHLDTQ